MTHLEVEILSVCRQYAALTLSWAPFSSRWNQAERIDDADEYEKFSYPAGLAFFLLVWSVNFVCAGSWERTRATSDCGARARFQGERTTPRSNLDRPCQKWISSSLTPNISDARQSLHALHVEKVLEEFVGTRLRRRLWIRSWMSQDPTWIEPKINGKDFLSMI